MKKIKTMIRMAMCMVVLLNCTMAMHALEADYYAQDSKLASGKWVKISVMESGIYQITADDIRDWGLGSDLSQIHIFGYGGAPLSEEMLGDNYADDLPQMPVVRTDNRILFYAQGPLTWESDEVIMFQQQVQHPYAKSGSYFVTNDSRFKDIEIEKAQNEPAGDVKTTYTERLYHEQDIINPGETGRRYLGEDFKSNASQTFSFDLDGLAAGTSVGAYISFGALTKGANSTLKILVNDSVYSTKTIKPESEHDHYKLSNTVVDFELFGTNTVKLGINYSCPGTVS